MALTRLCGLLGLAAFVSACSLVIRDPFADLGKTRGELAEVVSRADALEDLDALVRLINNVHADPYRFRPREAFQAEQRRAADTMPESMTKGDLCLRLSRVVAVLDYGHTSMGCYNMLVNEWRRAAAASPPQTQRVLRFAPFMRLDDQQHLIVGWHGESLGVDPGDRILRINGQDADALLASWAQEVSHDTDAGRRAEVARRYRVYLALHGINAPYRLTVAAPGAPSREVTVEGDPVNYQFQDRPPQPPRPLPDVTALQRTRKPAVLGPIKVDTAFFTYRILEPDIGLVNFFSLFDGLDTVAHFKKAVDALFAQIALDRPRALVIDVRENGGGEDSASAELLRHITRKPFRLLTSWQAKRSQEIKDYANSIIRIPFRWMGLHYLSSEARTYLNGKNGTLSRPKERPIKTFLPGEPFFAGPVCVLTGPHTFSAGSEFAEAVKAFGLATIVGEETGGQPNSFGNQMPLWLPRSRLYLQIATVRSVRGSGSLTDNSAVQPDIVVRTTAEDIRAFFDPVLDRARTCPERPIH